MTWVLLKTINDWEKYKKDIIIKFGLGDLPVSWGNGPREYPCLVVTYMPANNITAKLVSAYVFMSDAELLLRSKIKDTSSQDNYNRWVAAYLLALVRELKELGALKDTSFERSLIEGLQLVDETTTENRDKLDKVQTSVLDRLFPRE